MRRPGVTLVEVLAAIGIMAIGMLAVLVLFPVGALSIAKALKDDRCGTIAGNGHAIAAAMLIGNDNTDLDAVPATNPTFGIYNVLDENYVPPQEKPTDPVYQRANPKSLGYPVYVDPFYVYSGVTGNTGDPNELPAKYLVYRHVARRSPLYLRQLTNVGDRNAVMERHYAFTDDFTFTANGYPKLERQGLYTWAYMIRRIRADSPSTVQMQIVVYSGRPIEAPEAEESYRLVTPAVEGVEGSTSFELTWRNDPNPAVPRVTKLEERPELRRGMWLYGSWT
jgi:hypothetical protein